MMMGVNEELIKAEIQGGLEQVDSTFVLTEFSCEFDRANRHLTVNFTATDEAGETITTSVSY